MRAYLDNLQRILETGGRRGDRTGTGTLSVFGLSTEYNLQNGFPLVTTKKMFLKGIIHELLWFLTGQTNTEYLTNHKVRIWDDWADEDGEVGELYGYQWRSWYGLDGTKHDQIADVIDSLRNDPDSRRHVVSTWNVGALESMCLYPCHILFQFYVREGKWLDCQLYQRSADMFLGVPFNIASYSLLTMMIAAQVGLEPGRFIHTIGDAHIYSNHVKQVEEQLSRRPNARPVMLIEHVGDIDEYDIDDFTLTGYNPHPTIKAPIAV